MTTAKALPCEHSTSRHCQRLNLYIPIFIKCCPHIVLLYVNKINCILYLVSFKKLEKISFFFGLQDQCNPLNNVGNDSSNL